MEDFVVKLKELADTEQPALLKLCDFARVEDQSLSDAEKLFKSVVTESYSLESSEQYRCVYIIQGRDATTKRVVLHLVNETEVESAKSCCEEGSTCKLYGLYKGNQLSLNKLSAYKFSKRVQASIKLSSDVDRDGNAKRAAVQAKIKVERSTTSASTSRTQTESKPSTSAKSFFNQSDKSTTTISAGKTMTSLNAGKNSTNKQSKLDFSSKLKTAQLKSKQPSDKEDVTSRTNTQSRSETQSSSSSSMKSEPPVTYTEETSSNKQIKEKPAHKRVKIVSDSSDEETEEPLKTKQKEKTEFNKHAATNGEGSEKSNKVKSAPSLTMGLLLDPDDIQLESDEEFDHQRDNMPHEEKAPKKRGRKRKSVDHEDETEGTSKNKKNTPNFGKVKAGTVCPNMKSEDRTWEDENGFMVTEKVMVEDRTPKPQPPKPKILQDNVQKPKTDNPPSKKKAKSVPAQQSSLLSFFTKK